MRLRKRAKTHESEGRLKEGLFSLQEDMIMGLCMCRAALKRQQKLGKKKECFVDETQKRRRWCSSSDGGFGRR